MRTAAPKPSPAAQLRFREYLLENVYLRTTEAERSEIISLWHNEAAFSDQAEAERRSHEAVFVVRNASCELCGLSTVGFVRVGDGRTFYAYRMFLRKRDRVPYLMLAVVLATRDFLSTFQHPKFQPAGLLHVNENPKLMRPGLRRLFARVGYQYWGQTPEAEDVWAFEFGAPSQRFTWAARWCEALKKLLSFWRRRQASRLPFTAI